MKRYALVSLRGDSTYALAGYLPTNYKIIAIVDPVGDNEAFFGRSAIIGGEDNAGWTLDGYVIPRLGSGLYAAREIILDDVEKHLEEPVRGIRYRNKVLG